MKKTRVFLKGFFLLILPLLLIMPAVPATAAPIKAIITIPSIISFTPSSGPAGTQVVISGSNFSGATAVNFGQSAASVFKVNYNTRITATVGSGSTGKISVITPGGTASSKTNFVFNAAPSISSFTPAAGGSLTRVVITGANLSGASRVKFGATPASSFIVNSTTQISAVVGSGSSGNISVTTPGGTAASNSVFSYYPAPAVSSFTPASAGQSTTITISGSNLGGTTAVRFGSTLASSFTVISNTRITAVTGSGSTGKVAVTTPGGTANSATNFTFIPSPLISSFSPASGLLGTRVTITGTNLSRATAVKLGGTPAGSFTVVSSTRLTAIVGSGSTGKISVTTPGGTATSSGTFTCTAVPAFSSFTPASAAQGSTVTINGTNLGGATAVRFGGTPAGSFTVVSSTSITAVVGSGSTGKISVTTPGGTATSSGTFTCTAVPAISSFTPASAAQGSTVTINGTNLGGATAVRFGGTPAGSFTVVSSTRLTAIVGSGSTGKISATTPGGTATSSGTFTYQGSGPVISTITLTDNDLPPPPVSGMTFHFVAPSAGDFGPAKISITYSFLSYGIWLGTENGQIWIYHLPRREDLPPSLQSFYDYLGIDANTTYTPDGRYWLNGVPPWLNLSKYDPSLTGLPYFTDIWTTSGRMMISHRVN